MERKSGAMPLMFVKMFVATVSPEIHWTPDFKQTKLNLPTPWQKVSKTECLD